jgi:hypothetical protein
VIKTVLGYRRAPGVTEEEYERWLFDVHAPDLIENPHLDRLVFNKVERPVLSATGGVPVPQEVELYRIAEMHFADEVAYQRYLDWWRDHPIPPERSPAGRTEFVFYVVTTPRVVESARTQRASPRSDSPDGEHKAHRLDGEAGGP